MSQPTISHAPRAPRLPSRRERRAWVRRSCELETACLPFASGESEPISAYVADVSVGGIRLTLTRRFEPGAVLVVELECPQGSLGWVPLARVVTAEETDGGYWAHGCAFLGTLSERQLAELLA